MYVFADLWTHVISSQSFSGPALLDFTGIYYSLLHFQNSPPPLSLSWATDIFFYLLLYKNVCFVETIYLICSFLINQACNITFFSANVLKYILWQMDWAWSSMKLYWAHKCMFTFVWKKIILLEKPGSWINSQLLNGISEKSERW